MGSQREDVYPIAVDFGALVRAGGRFCHRAVYPDVECDDLNREFSFMIASLILAAVLVLLAAVCVANAVTHAVEGYEDDAGFHYGNVASQGSGVGVSARGKAFSVAAGCGPIKSAPVASE